MREFTFTFDHMVSDGAGGYGAVRVEVEDEVYYYGRTCAAAMVVGRFPDARLDFDHAQSIVTFVSRRPTGRRMVVLSPNGRGGYQVIPSERLVAS